MSHSEDRPADSRGAGGYDRHVCIWLWDRCPEITALLFHNFAPPAPHLWLTRSLRPATIVFPCSSISPVLSSTRPTKARLGANKSRQLSSPLAATCTTRRSM